MPNILFKRIINPTYNQLPTSLPVNSYIFTQNPTTRIKALHVRLASASTANNPKAYEIYEMSKSPMYSKGVYITDNIATVTKAIVDQVSSVVHWTATKLIHYEVYKMSLVFRHETKAYSFPTGIFQAIEIINRNNLLYCVRRNVILNYDRSPIIGDITRSYKVTNVSVEPMAILGTMDGAVISDPVMEIGKTLTIPQARHPKGLYFVKHPTNPYRMDIYYRDRRTMIKMLGYNDQLIPFMIGDKLRQHNRMAYADSREQLLGYRGDVNPLGIYPKDGKYVVARYDKTLKQYIDLFTFTTSSSLTFNKIIGLNSSSTQIDNSVNTTHHHLNDDVLRHIQDDGTWLTYKGRRLLKTLPAPW